MENTFFPQNARISTTPLSASAIIIKFPRYFMI